MNTGSALAMVLGVATLTWMLTPIFMKKADQEEAEALASGEAHDLVAQKETLLAALKDLEDDLETAKISEEDYGPLKNQLTAETIEIMKKLDSVE
jgi:hypothetical protein